MAAFGVHFGTTSACLAVFKDGKTKVVANELGDRTTPCVVAYTDHDQAVGVAAKQGSLRNAQNTISYVKRVLGREWDDPVTQSYISKSQVKAENKDGKLQYVVDYKGETVRVSPRDVAKAIYKQMMETASSHGDGDIHDSVLAVPTEFSQDQRKVFSDCATEAGFNVLRIINEPVAAVLAYDLGQTDTNLNCNALVFRLGGDSTDISVVHIQNGLYRIMGSKTDAELAGSKFTIVLAEYLAQEFYKQYKLDVKESRRSFNKLRLAAENCKHTLSTLTNAQFSIDSLHEGVDYHNSVSRARFESLCGSLTQQCISLIDSLCQECNYTTGDFDKVILCGGCAKIPLVQKSISDYFKNAEVLNSIPPDEVIAIGAAKQAAILTGNDETEILENENDNEVECLSKAVCVKGLNSNNESILYPIFSSYTPIPSRKHEIVHLQQDQTSLHMDICECIDILNPDTAQHLAQIVMRDLPGESKVAVTFHLRREGSLHVTCREETTNKLESVTVDVCS